MRHRSRYRFGENWARFAEGLDADALDEASHDLAIHAGEVRGRRFLDVGSGSGLMSAAALTMGASRVLAIDLDPVSVSTTRRVLETLAPSGRWEVREGDLLGDDFGEWDIVYSWGVLHHTGDARLGLRRTTRWVAPGGRLVVGIYMRTPMCVWWAREKRWYSQASSVACLAVRSLYIVALVGVWTIRGRLREELRSRQRGMSLVTDADDWLGGYPYESMTLDEIKAEILPLGFAVEAEFPEPPHLGLLGSGNQTIRFRRL